MRVKRTEDLKYGYNCPLFLVQHVAFKKFYAMVYCAVQDYEISKFSF